MSGDKIAVFVWVDMKTAALHGRSTHGNVELELTDEFVAGLNEDQRKELATCCRGLKINKFSSLYPFGSYKHGSLDEFLQGQPVVAEVDEAAIKDILNFRIALRKKAKDMIESEALRVLKDPKTHVGTERTPKHEVEGVYQDEATGREFEVVESFSSYFLKDIKSAVYDALNLKSESNVPDGIDFKKFENVSEIARARVEAGKLVESKHKKERDEAFKRGLLRMRRHCALAERTRKTKAWINKYGSDLLKARMEEDLEWSGLFVKENIDFVLNGLGLPGGLNASVVERYFEEESREAPTLEEIQLVKKIKALNCEQIKKINYRWCEEKTFADSPLKGPAVDVCIKALNGEEKWRTFPVVDLPGYGNVLNALAEKYAGQGISINWEPPRKG